MRMYRKIRRFSLLIAGCTALAYSGCATSAQYQDFGRTEVARVISDVLGQVVFTSLLSGSSNPGVFQ